MIHRDIKPENILLHDGQALVADFGIALAVQSAGGQRMTQTGLSLGTPQYMSPEQAMGERTIDARSDVYALGAVLYEMLAGDAPFIGSSVQAIVAKVMNEKPTPIHTLRDTVPLAIEQAVSTALAKLPSRSVQLGSRVFGGVGEHRRCDVRGCRCGAGAIVRARSPDMDCRGGHRGRRGLCVAVDVAICRAAGRESPAGVSVAEQYRARPRSRFTRGRDPGGHSTGRLQHRLRGLHAGRIRADAQAA